MIQTDITCRNFEADDKLRSYITDKVNDLEKYVPKAAREALRADITLTDDPSGREDNRFVCEVIMDVKGERLMAKEGMLNMYAAFDIVEAKLRSQLRSYKDKHVNTPRRARMLGRLMGRQTDDSVVEPTTE